MSDECAPAAVPDVAERQHRVLLAGRASGFQIHAAASNSEIEIPQSDHSRLTPWRRRRWRSDARWMDPGNLEFRSANHTHRAGLKNVGLAQSEFGTVS